MNRDVRLTLAYVATAIMVMMALLLSLYTMGRACGNDGKHNVQKIVVFHAYKESLPNYSTFDNTLANTLREEHINANIKNVYLDLADFGYVGKTTLDETVRDAIDQAIDAAIDDSAPDLIMVEDDKAMWAIISSQHKMLQTIPIVVGGLCHSQWFVQHRFNNICGYYEEPNYVDNIEMATMLWSRHYAPLLNISDPDRYIVNVGLDHTMEDSLVRAEIHSAIARPSFADYTMRPAYDAIRNSVDLPLGSIMVMATSLRDPSTNASPEDCAQDSTLSWRALSSVFANSRKMIHLQVVKDEFGESMAASSGLPQFTMLRTDFANGKKRFLAGRFASYETVARDMASAASLILKGMSPVAVGFTKHDSHFYMDYDVMSILGLHYDDFAVESHGVLRSNYFVVLRAPESQSHPWIFYSKVGLCVLAFIILIIYAGASVTQIRLKARRLAMESIAQDEELAQMALPHGACHVIYWQDGAPVLPYNLETWRDMLEAEIAALGETMKAAQTSVEDTFTREFRLPTNEMNGHWWQLRATSDPNLRDWLLVDIDHDIRWQQNIEEAREQANKALTKGQFLQNVSHEIRTPLNAIIGFSDIMATMPITASEREDLGKRVLHSSRQLMQLVSDVLTVSRIETKHSKMEDPTVPTDISTVMQEVADTWRAKGTEALKDLCEVARPDGNTDIEFRTLAVRDNIWAICSASHLKIVLDRLLHNAFKFTPSGTVVLSWTYVLESNEVEIFIEDTGVGISIESRQQIYDIFFKEDVFIHGAGLGLTIAKGLIERMSGRIEMRSEKNVGTRISIYLPACRPNAAIHATDRATTF